MSLLMEALKKAEQAKQSGEAAPASDGALRLEPIDSGSVPAEPAATAPAGKRLPDLPTQLEVLDAEFMAHADLSASKRPAKPAVQQPPPPRPAPAKAPAPGHAATPSPHPAAALADGERKAAQQVFAAKQPERSRKGFVITVSAMTAISLAAIGGYFWWQLQPGSGLLTQPPRNPAAAPPSPAPAAPSTAQIAAVQPAVPPAAAREISAVPAGTTPRRDDDEADEAPPPRRAAVRSAPPPAESESPVRITRSRLRLNPDLARGFDALNAGDLAAAQAEYERVLRSEPRNSDALHGMAAIAVRQGNPGRAEEYWLKALEADPKDALAQAALIGSGGRGGADPLAQESRLKTLIAAQPEIAALHFALGNVFARQNRWAEAQQAYFKAFALESEHPDYAYNLAVSLDHLRQPGLAAQYYNQALAAAGKQLAGFDRTQVAARLRELQPQ